MNRNFQLSYSQETHVSRQTSDCVDQCVTHKATEATFSPTVFNCGLASMIISTQERREHNQRKVNRKPKRVSAPRPTGPRSNQKSFYNINIKYKRILHNRQEWNKNQNQTQGSSKPACSADMFIDWQMI